jgi:hypothetical protein
MAQYTIGEFDAYWAEMGDETQRESEHEFLQGHLVDFGQPDESGFQTLVVRSAQTGRLWDVVLDESGVTVECTEHIMKSTL